MKKILVADDNPVSRELVVEALVDDYLVLEAWDGRGAVDLFRSEGPDLGLIDIQMPELDGFGFLELVGEDARRRRVPLVALTAFAMQGDREKAIQAGFDAYITKPVNIKELRQQVRAWLGE